MRPEDAERDLLGVSHAVTPLRRHSLGLYKERVGKINHAILFQSIFTSINVGLLTKADIKKKRTVSLKTGDSD